MSTKPTYPAHWHDKTGYPYLNHLIGAYFHQDFDIDGHTLAEIIPVSKAGFTEQETQSTIADIQRFLADYGNSDADVAREFKRIFRPEITVEGWEGLTTRQWLLRIAELLQRKE